MNASDAQAQRRLIQAERLGLKLEARINRLYNATFDELQAMLDGFYSNNGDNGVLNQQSVNSLLSSDEKARLVTELRRLLKLARVNFDTIYTKAYINKMTRIQALRELIYWRMLTVGRSEEAASTQVYTEILNYTYMKAREEHKSEAPIMPVVPIALGMLTIKWLGGNYATRIWKNIGKGARKTADAVIKQISKLADKDKTKYELKTRIDVAKSNSMRLVRTEVTYYQGQSEIQALKDDGFIYYEYKAVLDKRTSEICEEHNGRRYKVEDARVGSNFPPLHPNCRSYVVGVIREEGAQ